MDKHYDDTYHDHEDTLHGNLLLMVIQATLIAGDITIIRTEHTETDQIRYRGLNPMEIKSYTDHSDWVNEPHGIGKINIKASSI